MTPRALPDSLWAATGVAAPDTIPLNTDIDCDVAIIGAGFTGLRAGLVLAEAGVSVVLLDAGDIGWGASGRNGGQVNPIGHETPDTIARQWQAHGGPDMAKRFTAMTIGSADELFSLVSTHGIDCDAEQNGWIRGLHGPAAGKTFDAMFDGWNRAGAALQMLDGEELAQMSGSRLYERAWFAPSGGSVQPLSYARGLARAALDAGAIIHTHTEVESLQAQADQWLLRTATGSVVANKVIVGTNGYSGKLIPGLRESIVPVVSLQSATRRLTDEEARVILPSRCTMADSRRVIYYFRKTGDGRLVFGSAGTKGDSPGRDEHQRLLRGLRAVYPQFPDLTLDYVWGGHIAVTQDHLPHIHEPMPGVIAGLGFNGRGVANATVMGRLLAERTMGKEDADLPIPVTRIKAYPFHRFHRVAIKLVVAYQERKDRQESRSADLRRPDELNRLSRNKNDQYH